MAKNTEIRPFTIDIQQSDLDELRDRLARTRWPDELPGVGAADALPLILTHGWATPATARSATTAAR